MKIDMERYNKSTMPENAEKYFNGPPGIRTHDASIPFANESLPDSENTSEIR